MLPKTHRQEALSRAYVRVIAAQAGATCLDVVQDYGIDMCLRGIEETENQYVESGAQLDVQLRSTTRAVLTETDVLYDLDVRAYDTLRREQPRCPRILVLLVLPAEETAWVSQTVEELMIRRCAYWVSLRGAAPTAAQTSVRIRIPRSQVFSAAALQTLLGPPIDGGTP